MSTPNLELELLLALAENSFIIMIELSIVIGLLIIRIHQGGRK